MINAAHNKQIVANKNMVQWKPNHSDVDGKYLMTTKANAHTSPLQNDAPKSLRFSGIISQITKNGNVSTAHDAMKMTNEKLATGMKLNTSTL